MKTKIIPGAIVVIIALAIAFSSVEAQSQDITVDVADSMIVRAGQEAYIVLNLTNFGSDQVTLNVGVSGQCPSWAILQNSQVTVPAGTSRMPMMKFRTPPKTSMQQCTLTVSAYSPTDSSKWNEDSINIWIISSSSTQTGKKHYQPEPDLNSQNSIGPEMATSGLGAGHVGVDIVFNPKLQNRGYIINDGGEVCVGDSFTLNEASLAGEWYSKGGPNDSPPVEFVEDLDAVKAKIEAGTYSTKTYRGTICSWRVIEDDAEGPPRCVVDASMVCSYNCNVEKSESLEKLSDYRFEVTEEGPLNVKMECPVECIFFIDRKEEVYVSDRGDTTILPRAYGTMDIPSPGTITSSTTINAIAQTRGPDIRVMKTTYLPRISADQPVYARLLVENKGDMEAIIDSVNLNLPNSQVMYKPRKMFPGEQAEILVKAEAEHVSEIKADIEYRADKLGCLDRKEFRESFGLGRIEVLDSKMCGSEGDCSGLGLTTPSCCRGVCRDAAIGACDDVDGDGQFEWSYY